MKIADRSSSEPHFVLLRHEMPKDATVDSHWDLMLEQPEGLFTLRLDMLPVLDNTVEEAAHPQPTDRQRTVGGGKATKAGMLQVKRLGAHRKKYLNYEGPVSGDRGEVFRLLAGTFRRVHIGKQSGNPVETIPPKFDLSAGARIELLTSNEQSAILDIPSSKENEKIAVEIVRWGITLD